MVEKQLRARGIRDERVLRAMLSVPRHEFVVEAGRALSYADQPLAIGKDQTISQPFMVAYMLEALQLTGKEKALEVGTGSGYAAAVLSQLCETVYTIESSAELARTARERLARLGFANVIVRAGDGSAGMPDAAPFDAIVVAAAAPSLPPPLVDQLAEGGRLAVPIGRGDTQILVLARKVGGEIRLRELEHCRFVPLTGQFGFSD